MQSDYKQQHKKNVIFYFAKYKKDDEPDRDCIVLIDAEFMEHFENKKGNSRTRNELSALTLVGHSKEPIIGPKTCNQTHQGGHPDPPNIWVRSTCQANGLHRPHSSK